MPFHLWCDHQRKNLQVSPWFNVDNKLFLGVSSFPPRCQEPLFWEEITFITSRSTIDSRRDITTYQLTVLHASEEPRPEMSSLLDNADLSQRLLDSTSSESRRRELKVTSERPSACSESIESRTTRIRFWRCIEAPFLSEKRCVSRTAYCEKFGLEKSQFDHSAGQDIRLSVTRFSVFFTASFLSNFS